MDRTSLEQLLSQGLCLAEIGSRFGRHESTIAYWVQRYGLEAVGRDKYAAKGGVAREELERLVAAGMSIAQIAANVGRSASTVRHWLVEYGLKTAQAQRHWMYSKNQKRLTLSCPRHGRTESGAEAAVATAA